MQSVTILWAVYANRYRQLAQFNLKTSPEFHNNPLTKKNGLRIYDLTGLKKHAIMHPTCQTHIPMIYNYYKGTAKNPDALNNQTYLNGASMDWTKANCQLDLRDWSNAWGSGVYSKIQNYLKNGPIVVFIDRCRYYTPDNSGHFVVVYRCTKSSGNPTAADFRVLDPAYKYAGSHDMTLQQSMNLVGGSQITQIETWSMGGGRKMP